MNDYDVIVIGAGIIGLATAYKILESEPSLKLCILEKEDAPGKHQTGRNSNVIHSGIYYKPGSMKAINCTNGYSMMIDFCKENQVEYELCGKIIVAVNEKEDQDLEALYKRGIENGLKDIKILSGNEVKELEPNVSCIKGIYVPYTGITDYKKVSDSILDRILKMKGNVFYSSKVVSITNGARNIIITKSGVFTSKYIVNCAGLYSDKIAKYFIKEISVRILPFRGEYYWIKDSSHLKINSLIYPVPNPEFPFLGIHLTKTLDGRIEAGPNAVPAFKREGYNKTDINISELTNFIFYKGTIKLFRKYWKTGFAEMTNSFLKSSFTNAVKKYLPAVKQSDLKYKGSGVRAQACDSSGNVIDDFVIFETERSLNICNAPSPAATASLSIGKTISERLIRKINN